MAVSCPVFRSRIEGSVVAHIPIRCSLTSIDSTILAGNVLNTLIAICEDMMITPLPWSL